MQLFVPPQSLDFAPHVVTWVQDGKKGLSIFRDDHAAFAFYSENSLWDYEGEVWNEAGPVHPPKDERAKAS